MDILIYNFFASPWPKTWFQSGLIEIEKKETMYFYSKWTNPVITLWLWQRWLLFSPCHHSSPDFISDINCEHQFFQKKLNIIFYKFPVHIWFIDARVFGMKIFSQIDSLYFFSRREFQSDILLRLTLSLYFR